jgi:L-asparaginase/Glu-tRNA(Gln) amidotransferase subunit D
MKAPNITNTIVDEANRRTYVVLAPRVLTDGELYRTIRRELLKRGGKPLAHGETLTLTVTSSGGTIASVIEMESQTEPPSVAVPNVDEPGQLPAWSIG